MLKSDFNERKNKRWTNKLSVYLINMMIHNAYIIYKHFSNEPNKIQKHLVYRKIVQCLLKSASTDEILSNLQHEAVEHAGHWPIEVISKDKRDCIICKSNNIRKTTRVYCEKCLKFLCIKECFKNYHTYLEETSSSSEEIDYDMFQ